MPRRRTYADSRSIPGDQSPPTELEQGAASRQALDAWFSVTYKELSRLAASVKRNDAHATISTATLVNEAWMKLANAEGLAPQSELHFKRIAACAMRQIVKDAARHRRAHRRGGGVAIFVTLDDSVDVPVSSNEDLLRLDAALDVLEKVSPRQAELVVLRFFGGHDVAEASTLLGIAESTALRDWRVAKAWLAAEIRSIIDLCEWDLCDGPFKHRPQEASRWTARAGSASRKSFIKYRRHRVRNSRPICRRRAAAMRR